MGAESSKSTEHHSQCSLHPNHHAARRYRRLTAKAQDDVAKERVEAQRRSEELARTIERVQQELEDRVEREVGRRIGVHKHQVRGARECRQGLSFGSVQSRTQSL